MLNFQHVKSYTQHIPTKKSVRGGMPRTDLILSDTTPGSHPVILRESPVCQT